MGRLKFVHFSLGLSKFQIDHHKLVMGYLNFVQS